MGTSSARRGPTTALWRAAKGAATRYLSPGGRGRGERPGGGEPVSGGPGGDPGAGGGVGGVPVYPEGGPGPGGLGAGGGGPGVGSGPGGAGPGVPGRGSSGMLAPGVAGVLAGSGGGLEEAVVRTALALVVGRGGAISGPDGAGSAGAAVSGHGGAPASGPGPGGAPGSCGGQLWAAPGRLKPDQGLDRGRRRERQMPRHRRLRIPRATGRG